MSRKELIRRYQILLATLGFGLSISGCYYEINGEKQDLFKLSTDDNAKVYDSIIYTKEYSNYLKVRGIKKEECILIAADENSITIKVSISSHIVKKDESIIYICKKYNMSKDKFLELNSDYSGFKDKKCLPIGNELKVEYDEIKTIPKQYIMYEWQEYIVRPGDNIYGFADEDWNIIEIVKNDNDLDENYTVCLNDIVYVPTTNSVYGITQDTTDINIYQ